MNITSYNATSVGSSWIVFTLATVNGKAITKHISAEIVQHLQKHRRIKVSGLVVDMDVNSKATKIFFDSGGIRKRKTKRMERKIARTMLQ